MTIRYDKNELFCSGDIVVRKKNLVLLLLLSVLIIAPLFAQDEVKVRYKEYDKGSSMFTFRAGVSIPTFYYRPFQDPTIVAFPDEMNTKVGGLGSIRYQGFVNSYLALGGELGYQFTYDDGEDLFTSVPFQAKLTYIPLQGTFEIPLSVGIGFAYNSYSGYEKPSFLSFLTTIEAGFSWYFKQNWGLTLSAGLDLIPEIYLAKHPHHDQSTLGAFMPITLSITYRSN